MFDHTSVITLMLVKIIDYYYCYCYGYGYCYCCFYYYII